VADEYAPYLDALNGDTTWLHRAGCLRITPGTHVDHDARFYSNPGLYIHTNSGHISTGLTQVLIEKSSGYIRLYTDGAINGVPIVTGDETAAFDRLMFGASGGNEYVNIGVSDPSGRVDVSSQADYDSIASRNLNLWIAFHSPLDRGTTGGVSRLDLLEGRIDALEGSPTTCNYPPPA